MTTHEQATASRFALWAFVAWLVVTLMWWALAFAPLPAPPLWLAAARSVCFGTLPNGLPEAWGWAGLIASPLAMLGFLLGVWGRELVSQLRDLAQRRAGRTLLVAMAFAPLLMVFWVGQRVVQAGQLETALITSDLPEHLPEAYPRQSRPAPGLGLLDQDGQQVSLADLSGRPVLLTFAFAHCKTICPVVVHTVKGAAAELEQLEPAVVVVTLDPWRDTPSSLPALARTWELESSSAAHVLSGAVDDVLEVLDAWSMPWDRDPKTGDVTHPGMIHVLAPDGTLAYSFNAPPVGWVVEAVRRLGEEGVPAA